MTPKPLPFDSVTWTGVALCAFGTGLLLGHHSMMLGALFYMLLAGLWYGWQLRDAGDWRKQWDDLKARLA